MFVFFSSFFSWTSYLPIYLHCPVAEHCHCYLQPLSHLEKIMQISHFILNKTGPVHEFKEKREKEKESAWERVIEIYNSLKTDAGKTSNSNTAVAPLLQPRHTAQCLTDNSFSKRKTTKVVSFTAEDPFSVPFLWCQMFYHVTGRCLGQASLKSLKFLKISSVKCALISPAHTDEYYFHVEMNYKWDL